MMSNFSNDTQKKRKAIGDDNDNESQHIPRSISDVDARQLSQLSDMTSPFDASYGNTSRTTVDELLATSVENSHNSNGDAQVMTSATEKTTAVARHLIKPHGKYPILNYKFYWVSFI